MTNSTTVIKVKKEEFHLEESRKKQHIEENERGLKRAATKTSHTALMNMEVKKEDLNDACSTKALTDDEILKIAEHESKEQKESRKRKTERVAAMSKKNRLLMQSDVTKEVKPLAAEQNTSLQARDQKNVLLVKREPADTVNSSSPIILGPLDELQDDATQVSITESERLVDDSLSGNNSYSTDVTMVDTFMDTEETDSDVDLAVKSVLLILRENKRLKRENSSMKKELDELKKKLQCQEDHELTENDTGEDAEDTSGSSDDDNDSDYEVDIQDLTDSDGEIENSDDQREKNYRIADIIVGATAASVSTQTGRIKKPSSAKRSPVTSLLTYSLKETNVSCPKCKFDTKVKLPEIDDPNSVWCTLKERGMKAKEITSNMVLCIITNMGGRKNYLPSRVILHKFTRTGSLSFYLVYKNNEISEKPCKSPITCTYCIHKNVYIKCNSTTLKPILSD